MEATGQLNVPAALTPGSALQIKMSVYFVDFTREYIRDIRNLNVFRDFPSSFKIIHRGINLNWATATSCHILDNSVSSVTYHFMIHKILSASINKLGINIQASPGNFSVNHFHGFKKPIH